MRAPRSHPWTALFRSLLPLAWLALAQPAAAALPAPPPTPAEPVTDTYHGTPVVDPYRWMEDMKSPRFQDWLKAQAAYAGGVLATLPGRAALRQRLGELADSGVSTRHYASAGGNSFYLKRVPGEPTEKLWVRQGVTGPERLLLDPNAVPGASGRQAIDWYGPSPDGRLVAVGLSPGGSEDSVLHLIEVASGRLRAERIAHTGLNQDGVAWLPDGSGFFYNRHPADERYNKSVVALHRLGLPASADRPVFGWELDAARSFELADLPYVGTAPGSPWALAEVLHGDAAARSYWVAPLASLAGSRKGQTVAWRRLVGPDDAVTTAVLAGGQVYALSQKAASRRELIVIDPHSGSRRSAIPAGDWVLQQLMATREAVYVKALDGGVSRLLKLPLAGGRATPLALPFEGTLREMTTHGRNGLLLRMDGWTRPPAVFQVDAQGRITPTPLQPALKLDVSGIEASRVMVKSADGTMVPMSLLTPRGMPRDGRRPTILSGYGAYGISLEPRFSPTRLAWLARGGASAVCHVRGGGELGDDWHRGGYIETKQNTVSDFIACAQWLIEQKIASPATLAGTGGSAGGITIGGAITQRPELFAAAHSSVGVSDMLRMELTPNGPPNIAEFGTVTNPAHFKAMFAISPYHRVKDGTAYPGVIVTTGANDPRVDAWMPGKMAARLQAANPLGKPVLLRVDFDAGHGIGSSTAQFLDETADVWSFFLWQMGDAAFQPRAVP
jgi:prolyl oligopeptidase